MIAVAPHHWGIICVPVDMLDHVGLHVPERKGASPACLPGQGCNASTAAFQHPDIHIKDFIPAICCQLQVCKATDWTASTRRPQTRPSSATCSSMHAARLARQHATCLPIQAFVKGLHACRATGQTASTQPPQTRLWHMVFDLAHFLLPDRSGPLRSETYTLLPSPEHQPCHLSSGACRCTGVLARRHLHSAHRRGPHLRPAGGQAPGLQHAAQAYQDRARPVVLPCGPPGRARLAGACTEVSRAESAGIQLMKDRDRSAQNISAWCCYEAAWM